MNDAAGGSGTQERHHSHILVNTTLQSGPEDGSGFVDDAHTSKHVGHEIWIGPFTSSASHSFIYNSNNIPKRP